MSRAFVKEGDGPDLPPRTAPALPPGAPNVISPAGAASFRDRRDALRTEREALAGGGVDDARKVAIDDELRWLDDRIAGFVVRPPPLSPDRVQFGCQVEVDGPSGVRRVRIVGVDEADPSAGDVSWVSPIARALIGARVGDEVTWSTPSGPHTVEVLAVHGG